MSVCLSVCPSVFVSEGVTCECVYCVHALPAGKDVR